MLVYISKDAELACRKCLSAVGSRYVFTVLGAKLSSALNKNILLHVVLIITNSN